MTEEQADKAAEAIESARHLLATLGGPHNIRQWHDGADARLAIVDMAWAIELYDRAMRPRMAQKKVNA